MKPTFDDGYFAQTAVATDPVIRALTEPARYDMWTFTFCRKVSAEWALRTVFRMPRRSPRSFRTVLTTMFRQSVSNWRRCIREEK
jgi:hypothetical protein